MNNNSYKTLSQFFTKENVVLDCLSTINLSKYALIIEPSAGDGAFGKHLRTKESMLIAMDIEPKFDECMLMDYMAFIPHKVESIAVIGNPPFGKNSSLAVKFFNHSAQFADTIAFIVPRTFRKNSLVNRLNENFHLIYEKILPIDSFYLPNGEDKSVTTCGQIGEKRNYKRDKVVGTSDTDYGDWTTKEYAELALRRVGVNAGKIIKNIQKSSPASHFYIRNIKPEAIKALNELGFNKWIKTSDSKKGDVSGNPSLSKAEIIKEVLTQKLNNNSANVIITRSKK